MSSLLPNILIIPGACVPALGYKTIVDRLREEGLNASVFELPTANGAALGHAATMEEDVAFFSGVLTAMCSTGADVVVLAHSYAGCVASDAIHGLTEKAAGRGRVHGLIALTAALPKVGESMGGLLAHLSFDLFEPKGDFVAHKDFSLSARILYNDLPLEEGVKWAETLRPQLAISYSGKVQHAAYRNVEKLFYLRCSADECLPPNFQDEMIKNGTDTGHHVEVHNVEGAGHCPNASMPDKVAQLAGGIVKNHFI
ncbi:hypothetical protein M409DRAFT_20707 [Zasmidium cellare ATCC 36951]|uniref:AB hydrolase-1 domain-containing protein n=1 Tax=Zasmidium cellare ATCC 36951 TaxID=1080233 RepID=A0A6A6CS07_ZASCE|nr:uncharacterized protein M409DRAFT_20707 [Zasmidium cellare ATCC 36951]KAF2169493.1 hypothetical protein M409DRAFT_20707 [Zasmidium cellare ATCC 36951]